MAIRGTGGSYNSGATWCVECDACHTKLNNTTTASSERAVELARANGMLMGPPDGFGPPKFICPSCARDGYSVDSLLCEVCGSNIRVKQVGTVPGSTFTHALCFLCYSTKRIEDVRDAIVKRKKALAPPAPMPLLGLTFCFTGKLTDTREKFWEMTRAHGGTVHDRVSTKHRCTDFLVCGSRTGAVKLAAAATAGVKCINENQFLAMLKPRPQTSFVIENPPLTTRLANALTTMPVMVVKPVIIPIKRAVDPAERERRANEARAASTGAKGALDALEEVLGGSSSKR